MVSKKKSLVSIIINCYNGEKFLNKTLNSVLCQTYKNWEIIFWDNKSTDQSKKIYKSFKDKRFKYFCSKKNCNLYKARKLALKKCKGEFIAFLDVDDWWFKDKLKRQILKFSDKKINLVYSQYYNFLEAKQKISKVFTSNLPEGNIASKLLVHYKMAILTVIIRKKILKELNLTFNEKYKIIGDFDLFIKIASKSKVSCVQKPLAAYRMHNENFTKNNQVVLINELTHWLYSNKKFFKKYDLNELKFTIDYLKIKQLIFKNDYTRALVQIFYLPCFKRKLKLLAMIIVPKKYFY